MKTVVTSSVIKAVEYSIVEKVLTITFNTGKQYSYLQVPVIEYNLLAHAVSTGKAFNSFIKNKYEFIKLEELELVN